MWEVEYSPRGVLLARWLDAMSILDTAPKTSVKLLVGRQQELQEIVRSVIEHRITVVLGPRRIGKTSLIKVALGFYPARRS